MFINLFISFIFLIFAMLKGLKPPDIKELKKTEKKWKTRKCGVKALS